MLISREMIYKQINKKKSSEDNIESKGRKAKRKSTWLSMPCATKLFGMILMEKSCPHSWVRAKMTLASSGNNTWRSCPKVCSLLASTYFWPKKDRPALGEAGRDSALNSTIPIRNLFSLRQMDMDWGEGSMVRSSLHCRVLPLLQLWRSANFMGCIIQSSIRGLFWPCLGHWALCTPCSGLIKTNHGHIHLNKLAFQVYYDLW